MRRRTHVAVLKPEYIEAILDGRKTVESRLSRTRREPLHKVSVGDIVYFKQSSGGYKAAARVDRVEYHERLSPEGVRRIKSRVNTRVLGSSAYWKAKRDARYATLVWLKDVQHTSHGPAIDRLYGRAWVVMGDSLRSSATSRPATRAQDRP